MNRSEAAIVVATDFSDDAWHAALRSAQLLRDADHLRRRLVHVVDISWLALLNERFGLTKVSSEALLDDARRSMQSLVDALFETCGLRFDGDVRVGPVIDTLVDEASNAQLLVLGARGQHPVREFALGTSAERVLRKRRASVLIVRTQPTGPYRRLLVPVDFSARSADLLQQARALAPQARLDVLHAYEVPFEGKLLGAGLSDAQIHAYRRQAREAAGNELDRLLSESAAAIGDAHRLLEYGYAPRVIVDIARERMSDLIVIGKHGKSIVEDLLLGSVTLHVLGESSCDVLVVQADSPAR